MTVDEVARLNANHHLKPYGEKATILRLTVDGRDARLILPDHSRREYQLHDAELVVPYASPLSVPADLSVPDGRSVPDTVTRPYDYFILYAHEDFIRSIARTIRFTDRGR
jgi:hypothetical protein